MKNPPWSRDEHIVALDFYLKHAPQIPGKESKEVIQLSGLLNNIEGKIQGDRTATYRNPAGVYMKLMNFRRFDPSYTGVGLANGSKDEQVVWDLYANKKEELSKLAAQIALFMASTEVKDSLPALDADEEEGNEGQLLSRVHRYRERDRTLVKKAKDKFTTEHGRIFCQACGFDFEKNMAREVRACTRFCVNGLMAGSCQYSQRKRNDRKQRIDRPPAGGLQKA